VSPSTSLRSRITGRRVVIAAVVVSLLAGVALAGAVVVVRLRPLPCSAAAAPVAEAVPDVDVTAKRTPVQTAGTTPPATTFGVYTAAFPGDAAALYHVAAAAGRSPDIVMWYVHWGDRFSAFDRPTVEGVLGRGATPMITWMSDDPTVRGYPDTAGQTAYRDSRITAGDDDAYIRSWAAGIRSVAGTVMLRLDHEMNCNWFGWDAGVNGQTAADFVAMWRHVHGIFSSMGVTNVRWVWSPNVATAGPAPLAALYPGDDAVDLVGLDGYNWGTSHPGKHWQSFSDVFAASIDDIRSVSHLPLLLTEVGCAEVGGDKAAWIADFLAQLAARPEITGFVWFDTDKETDWRFDSSPASAAAFRAGLARLDRRGAPLSRLVTDPSPDAADAISMELAAS